jgi:UrcA family protein
MNTPCLLKTQWLAGMAAGAVLLGATATAAPTLHDSRLRTVVTYDELDLATSKGAAVLYKRLRAAAHVVCAPIKGLDLARRAKYEACYKEALSNAVAEVNRDAVTAMHARATQGQRA